jgi:hypothetical protein
MQLKLPTQVLAVGCKATTRYPPLLAIRFLADHRTGKTHTIYDATIEEGK